VLASGLLFVLEQQAAVYLEKESSDVVDFAVEIDVLDAVAAVGVVAVVGSIDFQFQLESV